MNKLFRFLGIALCLLSPALGKGQDTGLFRMKKDLPPENDIAVWGGVEDGRFKPTHAPLFQWKAGADARMVRHGIRTSWTGSISLEQAMGKYQSSSLFLEPGYFPVDLWDQSAGTASRQTGRVEIGLLSDVSDLWAAGFNASVKAANEAKRGGLGHSTLGVEAQLEPTLTFISDDDACFISSYLVRVRTERAKAGRAGDGVLPVFRDNGMRYGEYETEMGLFPVLELSHGFYERYYSPELSGGFGITWKRGRAGEKNYSQFKFPGSTLKGFFEFTSEGFEIDQVYRVSYQRDRDQLREAREAGFAALSDRVRREVAFRFTLQPHEGAVKRAGIDLGGNLWKERAAVSVQDVARMLGGTATAFASLTFGSVDLDVRASVGGGRWLDRGRSYEDPGKDLRLVEDWRKNMDYRMLPRLGMGGTFTYHASFLEGLTFQVDTDWLRAFKRVHLGGKNRNVATLRIGYHF